MLDSGITTQMQRAWLKLVIDVQYCHKFSQKFSVSFANIHLRVCELNNLEYLIPRMSVGVPYNTGSLESGCPLVSHVTVDPPSLGILSILGFPGFPGCPLVSHITLDP